ncbi:MAG TPA: AMP-binding protein [Stellaceae bacterium]|nr:AMP-binding protein [Stellaceae bacterium]
MRIPVAAPTAHGRRLRAVTDQLEESQWWSPDLLQGYQFGQLERLLAHAHETVPFYRTRLAAAGYRPGQAITPEFWRSLPLLERRDLQDQGDALKSTSVPAEHGGTFKISTSGSTATPVSVWRSDLQALILGAVVLRKVLWQSWDFRLKLGAVIATEDGASFGPAGQCYPDWGWPSALVYQTGPAVVLDLGVTVVEIAEWLLREQPDYLRIYPVLLKDLSFHFMDRGLIPPRLKGIMCGAEVITSDLRELVRRVFGLELFASYGAREAGTIALQCPEREHYHVQAEVTLVEVLDDEGKPCAPGETGTVVVTPLQGFASPLIRYVIGDRAVVGASCPCGRPHPVLAQVVGRTRHHLVLPSGARRCNFDALAFWQFDDIRQYQIVQKSFHDLEVRLVVRRPLTEEVKAEVARRLKTTTSEHFSVAFTYHDSIPRTPSGKFRDFVCEVAADAPGAVGHA